MEPFDDRLYQCSHCFRRCLWHELSQQEHRCPECRLPTKTCAICDRMFEPRKKTNFYCKRCDFYLEKQTAVKPSPIEEDNEEEDAEETPGKASVMERWQEIKTAAGIVEDLYIADN